MAVVLAAVLWGTWKLWLVGPGLDPAGQGGLVLTTSGVLATGMALSRRRSWPGVPLSAWLVLALFGVTEGINTGLYFLALSAGNIAAAAATHYLAPVLIALASPFVGASMGRRAIPAAAVAFAATVVLVGLGGSTSGTRVAALAGAGSAVFYAAGVFLSKRITSVFTPWEIVGFHDLIAGPLIALTSHAHIAAAGSRELLLALAGAVVAGTIAAAVYMYGLTRIPPARAGILAYMEPVSAAVVGAVVLHQAVSSFQVGAMATIILAGVVVALEPAPPAGSATAKLPGGVAKTADDPLLKSSRRAGS